MIPYTPPEFNLTSFNCPHCHAFAKQSWKAGLYHDESTYVYIPHLSIAFCDHCGKHSVWQDKKMISPDESNIVPPNADLNDDIKADYNEATSIVNKSPRGAAALLRLCVQKLCKQLGESGDNLDRDIGNLVKKGLPGNIQKALDIVRVIGNNAVHPGQIDITDDIDTASRLFELVNHIAEIMITHPKKVDEMYNKLPEEKRKAIGKRDSSGAV